MTLCNYHTHNALCDGKGEIEEYVEAAIGKGFTALGFSSHAPIPVENEWTLKKEDLETYIAKVKTAKEKYREKIEIYLGLEVDFIPGILHPRDKWVSDLELDYVIGSVHFLPTGDREREFLTIDGPDEEFLFLLNETHRGSFPSLAGAYYHHIREMLRIGGFDILGHIDLIRKKNKSLRYLDESEPWYRNEITRTLAVLETSGIIMEINTGGIARGATDTPYPSGWIIEKAARLNIPIQLNADAHKPEWVDFHYPRSVQLAKESGVDRFRLLIGGKWQDIPVD